MYGLSYSAPVSGENQQTVQMADLDGDGVEEYIVFAQGNSANPLQVLIFRQEEDGTCRLMEVIQSNGSAFEQVEYVQMDNAPGYELVVGRQLSDQVLRSVSVYSFSSGSAEQLMMVGYSKFITCDLNDDGCSELMGILPGESETGTGSAVLYRVQDGSIERSVEVNVSEDATHIRRITVGRLLGGTPAVFVASAVINSAIVTDVFAWRNDRFSNISYSRESDTSVQTLRNYYVYAEDIDGEMINGIRAGLMGPVAGIGDSLLVGTLIPMKEIAPGATASDTAMLYSGPQAQERLEKLAPGLELVVDYGWLTFLAKPIYWLLSFLYGIVGNWGWSLVLLTCIVKAILYPISAAGYRSMARMKEVTPRMKALQEKYKDDKQRLNQAMMELYRTEKINPVGGCLPIMLQIPVFLALYWVLQGAVELRGADWMLWVQDLAMPDPWFVLPTLMAVTMFLQIFLNPKPTDPTQARIMYIMPVVFSVMFFVFAAGLVLYWLTNNVFSILQQWWINKTIAAERAARMK